MTNYKDHTPYATEYCVFFIICIDYRRYDMIHMWYDKYK